MKNIEFIKLYEILDGKMYRGCMSDKTEGKMFCERNKADCFKCNSSDCNYLQSFQLKNPIDVYQHAYPSENSSSSFHGSFVVPLLFASINIILVWIDK